MGVAWEANGSSLVREKENQILNDLITGPVFPLRGGLFGQCPAYPCPTAPLLPRLTAIGRSVADDVSAMANSSSSVSNWPDLPPIPAAAAHKARNSEADWRG